MKSGGDRFTGNWYSDYIGREPDQPTTCPTPSAWPTSATKTASSAARRCTRGNPVDKQYDLNFNVGGPLWKGKAWFFYSYRLNDQYKYTLGTDVLARSKLTNNYTFKGTFQLNRNNQVIGFLNKRNKLQELRDFAPPLVPDRGGALSGLAQLPVEVAVDERARQPRCSSTCSPATGTTSSRSIRPTSTASRRTSFPGRIDTGNNQRTGYHDAYQDQKRYKPQVYVNMSYFQDGWHGSHDFKFGYDWKRDRRHFGRAQPFDIHYRDLNSAVNELEIYNSPNTSTNDVVYNAGFISDTWKFNDRLTLQPRPAPRALRRQLPGSGDDAERSAAAGQLAGDGQPGGARALPELHRAAARCGA